MLWREYLGDSIAGNRGGRRQYAVVQGTSSSWTLTQSENQESFWNNNRKLDDLDKMVAMECTGCTGNLGNKIRKKMGK